MTRNTTAFVGLAVASLAAFACSSEDGSGSSFGGGVGAASVDGGPGPTSGTAGGPVFGGAAAGDGGADPAGVCAPSPGNYDIPGNGCDDDGDGKVDNATTCDGQLAVDGDATSFARALGLCQTATGPQDAKWGLVGATYTNGFNVTTPPAAGQTGILPKFGSVLTPREGASLGVLSTGFAREFDEATPASATFKGGKHMQTNAANALPAGFPKAAQGCPIVSQVFDLASVQLQIKVPMNAKGVSFDFNFHSGEWPEYVCTAFNDGFIAYLTSAA